MNTIIRIPTFLIFVLTSFNPLGLVQAQHFGQDTEHMLRGNRGKRGLLQISKATLKQYPELEPAFEQALEKINRARKTIKHLVTKGCHTDAEWSRLFHAYQQEIGAREGFAEALRAKIADRQTKATNLIENGLFDKTKAKFTRELAEQGKEWVAFSEVVKRIQASRATIQNGTMPNISWPGALSSERRRSLEHIVKNAASQAGDPGAWKLLERQIESLGSEFEEGDDDLRKYLMHNMRHVDTMKKDILTELRTLSMAHKDLVSMSLLQGRTMSAQGMSMSLRELWVPVHGEKLRQKSSTKMEVRPGGAAIKATSKADAGDKSRWQRRNQ